MKQKDQEKSNAPRLLKPEEAERLLKDAKETRTWMRAEIKRRHSDRSAIQYADRESVDRK
jgi:hypothetical protein